MARFVEFKTVKEQFVVINPEHVVYIQGTDFGCALGLTIPGIEVELPHTADYTSSLLRDSRTASDTLIGRSKYENP